MTRPATAVTPGTTDNAEWAAFGENAPSPVQNAPEPERETPSSHTHTHTHTHKHPFNGPLSRTTRVSRYQKGKTSLDVTEARDSELQWHQLGHMQVCTSLQIDNHASTPPLRFLQAGCPSSCPPNSVKAPKASETPSSQLEIEFYHNVASSPRMN